MKDIWGRRRALKQKLRDRENVFGAWTSLGHASITEIFSQSGVDFIGIDIEHSTISEAESQQIIAASQAHQLLCLPRIATHNQEVSKRLLDAGADGLIFPMVDTATQARQLNAWCKFPPQGNRSFGVSRAHGYGFHFDAYAKQWNDASIIIVQIESVKAVENIKQIVSCDDIDGVMIGPYDLSGSLGVPGELNHPQLKEATQHVIETCKTHQKACGSQIIEPTQKVIQNVLSEGYTFVVLASDVFLLWKWSAKMKEILSELRHGK